MSASQLAARHIAVEGPIGVGKTSLVELLAARFEGVKILEDVANPFLDPFYRGKAGAAFQVQIFFLLSRHQQHAEIAQRELFTRSWWPTTHGQRIASSPGSTSRTRSSVSTIVSTACSPSASRGPTSWCTWREASTPV